MLLMILLGGGGNKKATLSEKIIFMKWKEITYLSVKDFRDMLKICTFNVLIGVIYLAWL